MMFKLITWKAFFSPFLYFIDFFSNIGKDPLNICNNVLVNQNEGFSSPWRIHTLDFYPSSFWLSIHIHKAALVSCTLPLAFFPAQLLNNSWALAELIQRVSLGLSTQQPLSQFEQLWVYALSIAHSRKKLLCPWLIGSLAYRYKYEFSGGSWVIAPFRNPVLNQLWMGHP